MKKISTIIGGVAAIALFMASCAPQTTLQKDIKYMSIHFKPLSRADFTLVGNLQSEVTITGKGSGPKKVIDASFASNYKKGLISKSELTEIMYFAPGPGEAISGNLYDNEVFNTVSTTANVAAPKKTLLQKLLPGIFAAKPNGPAVAPRDDAMNFAYYAMVAKYPEVDYFINVRFDRKTVYKGKSFSETVTVKADGVKLRTD